ncbi:hypothetical protein OBBRIDRAFT_790337 [Obba rivulosa]|uniref:Uncharacterized protein n=1 Tax=Obba rivulosa TaxID=1052685 RepID=A0A8E2J4R6_9APHY|nr:hypothetical protein OBBRIDRAFT_790337 [Obba rivulosa]
MLSEIYTGYSGALIAEGPSRDGSAKEKSELSTEVIMMKLRPMTAAQNIRYDKKSLAHLNWLIIPQGLHTSGYKPKSDDMPVDWNMYVHPEGTVYYVNTSSEITIVTDTPIYDPAALRKLEEGVSLVCVSMSTSQTVMPNIVELYIYAEPDAEECKYYLIDHESQTEFWLDDVEMSSLYMPPVSSEAHLKYTLQEHYWTHVEYFPHRPMPMYIRIELLDILRHGSADQMTSDNSTFPFDAEQCTKLAALIDVQNTESTTYMTCSIARIFVMIARHRYDHFYGEECVRLCRDQSVYEWPEVKPTSVMRLCSALLFNFPKAMRRELELLYVDKIVYTIHWRAFMHTTKDGWQKNAATCAGLLLTNAVFIGFVKNTVSMCSGMASMMLSLGGLLSGCALLHAYSYADKVNAATMTVYLRDIENSMSGFEPIAAIFSLPKALMLWSILFLSTDILTLLFSAPDLLNMIALGIIAILVSIAFVMMTVVLRRPSVDLMV